MNKPIFASDQHRAFYDRCMARVRNDCYHRALFYLIGVSADTRKMVGSIFDFDEDCIHPEALHSGWQTDGTYQLCLLAFNLWNGYTDADRKWTTTPEELLCCSFAPYMLEGIKLRYPEYCREIEKPKATPQER